MSRISDPRTKTARQNWSQLSTIDNLPIDATGAIDTAKMSLRTLRIGSYTPIAFSLKRRRKKKVSAFSNLTHQNQQASYRAMASAKKSSQPASASSKPSQPPSSSNSTLSTSKLASKPLSKPAPPSQTQQSTRSATNATAPSLAPSAPQRTR